MVTRLHRSFRLAFVLVLLGAVVVPARARAATACTVDAVAALHVPNVTVLSATPRAAAPPNPAFCLVVGTVRTEGFFAPPGSATFALSLPASWNHKLLVFGQGGFAGSLTIAASPVDATIALGKGYATSVTDTGHTGGATDASWALTASGAPDRAKLTDYYFRAVHQVTVADKALVKAFYGARSIDRAYFDGCSNGGRQAFVEATKFPEDFDGIIAGAPFFDIRSIVAGAGIQKQQLQDVEFYVPAAKLAMVDRAVYASCDAADGVTDSLIQNPAVCAFDPGTLVTPTCTPSDLTCLTEGQAETLRAYFHGIRLEHDEDDVTYPGATVTDLDSGGGADLWTTGFVPPTDFNANEPWGGTGFSPAPVAWQFVDHFLKFVVERNPSFDLRDFDVENGTVSPTALRLFDERSEVGDGDNPFRLLPFLFLNKKLLIYHGFSDPALPPFRTVLYYEHLARLAFGDFGRIQRNVRFFTVPGMQHCVGGPGPNVIDTLTPLENWVENGTAPDGIVATKFVNNNPAMGVSRTMPLCMFPEEAQYGGSGNVNDAASWSCRPGDRSLLRVGPNGREAGLDGDRH